MGKLSLTALEDLLRARFLIAFCAVTGADWDILGEARIIDLNWIYLPALTRLTRASSHFIIFLIKSNK